MKLAPAKCTRTPEGSRSVPGGSPRSAFSQEGSYTAPPLSLAQLAAALTHGRSPTSRSAPRPPMVTLPANCHYPRIRRLPLRVQRAQGAAEPPRHVADLPVTVPVERRTRGRAHSHARPLGVRREGVRELGGQADVGVLGDV